MHGSSIEKNRKTWSPVLNPWPCKGFRLLLALLLQVQERTKSSVAKLLMWERMAMIIDQHGNPSQRYKHCTGDNFSHVYYGKYKVNLCLNKDRICFMPTIMQNKKLVKRFLLKKEMYERCFHQNTFQMFQMQLTIFVV